MKPPLESPGRLTNVLVITRLLHIKFDVASSNFNPWLCRLVWLFLHFLHSRPPPFDDLNIQHDNIALFLVKR